MKIEDAMIHSRHDLARIEGHCRRISADVREMQTICSEAMSLTPPRTTLALEKVSAACRIARKSIATIEKILEEREDYLFEATHPPIEPVLDARLCLAGMILQQDGWGHEIETISLAWRPDPWRLLTELLEFMSIKGYAQDMIDRIRDLPYDYAKEASS